MHSHFTLNGHYSYPLLGTTTRQLPISTRASFSQADAAIKLMRVWYISRIGYIISSGYYYVCFVYCYN